MTTDDRSLLGERWVLETSDRPTTEADEQAQICALRSQYYSRFLEEWKGFLATIRVEEASDSRSAIGLLQSLTRGEPPPFERIMRSVAHHAELPLPAPTVLEGAASAATETALARLEKRLRAVGGPADSMLPEHADPCAREGSVRRTDVAAGLEGFYRFGVPRPSGEEGDAGGERGRAHLDPHLPGAARIRPRRPPDVRRRPDGVGGAPRSAPAVTHRDSRPHRGAGGRVAIALRCLALASARDRDVELDFGARGRTWDGMVHRGRLAVRAFAARSLSVLARRSGRGARRFSRSSYRPSTGTVWRFYDATLARDVRRVGERFEPVGGEGVSNLYLGQLPTFLERSQAITNALFPAGVTDPRVDFEVRIRPTPGIASTELVVDGRRVDYRNGPEQWVRLRWPGEGDTHGASLRVRGAGVDETIEQGGEWGVLRLLDAGTVRGNPGERFFSVVFHLRTQGLDVVLDVRPARADNPFVPLAAGEARTALAVPCDGRRRPARHHEWKPLLGRLIVQEASSTRPIAASIVASVFGKVPASAEFVRLRAQHPAGLAVQDFLLHGHERLVASGRKLVEPVYFALAVPVAGTIAVGAVVDGSDAVGRAFPLAVFAEIESAQLEGDAALLPIATQAFWEQAGALASRAATLDVLALDSAALALPAPLERLSVARAICAEARRHERARAFLERCFAATPESAAHYAVYTLYHAVRAPARRSQPFAPHVLDCPVTIDVDLFAWLSMVSGLLASKTIPSFLWTVETPRLLVALGAPPPAALAWIVRRDADAAGLWPLHTSVDAAARMARDELPTSVRSALGSDGSLGALIDAVVRGGAP